MKLKIGLFLKKKAILIVFTTLTKYSVGEVCIGRVQTLHSGPFDQSTPPVQGQGPYIIPNFQKC